MVIIESGSALKRLSSCRTRALLGLCHFSEYVRNFSPFTLPYRFKLSLQLFALDNLDTNQPLMNAAALLNELLHLPIRQVRPSAGGQFVHIIDKRRCGREFTEQLFCFKLFPQLLAESGCGPRQGKFILPLVLPRRKYLHTL